MRPPRADHLRRRDRQRHRGRRSCPGGRHPRRPLRQAGYPPAKLVERRFVDIDRDNFNEILSSISPRATLQVDNTISGDDSKLNVELRFNHIEDFDPVNLVKQVVPLRRLFEARQRLRDLLTKLDGNDDLDQLLQDVVANTEGLQEIKAARPEAEAAPAGDSEPPADQPA